MRKEKLQIDEHKIVVENITNDATLRSALLRDIDDKSGYPCPRCKKRYTDEEKLKVHLASHYKVWFTLYLFTF